LQYFLAGYAVIQAKGAKLIKDLFDPRRHRPERLGAIFRTEFLPYVFLHEGRRANRAL
jgi:hypothetical protein